MDLVKSDRDEGGFDEPVNPPLHRERPVVDVQEVFSRDTIAPPQTLRERSDHVPDHEPLDVKRYYSQAFHDLEVEKMWSRVWQYACWAHDLPKPGDVSVYRNVGQSVLIVRQRDGSLKAFRNSCLHRGREICTEDVNVPQLRCPYHAFTWGLDGASRWFPAAWDFPQIDSADFSLPEVRVEEWNGFVFVSLDPAAPPLEKFLGKMVDQWSPWNFKDTRYRAVTVELEIACNWKACMDAFIETLHTFATHSEAAIITPDTATQYDIYADEPHFSRFQTVLGMKSQSLESEPTEQEILDGYTSIYLPEIYGTDEGYLAEGESARQGLSRITRKVYKDRLGLDVSALPEAELIDGTEYLVFPNFIIWPSVANPLGYRFRPGDSPDTCIWETFIFLPFVGERPASGPVIRLPQGSSLAEVEALGYVGPLLQQDAENLVHMQKGFKASGTGVIQTAHYQEARIRHYHQTIDKYISGQI